MGKLSWLGTKAATDRIEKTPVVILFGIGLTAIGSALVLSLVLLRM